MARRDTRRRRPEAQAGTGSRTFWLQMGLLVVAAMFLWHYASFIAQEHRSTMVLAAAAAGDGGGAAVAATPPVSIPERVTLETAEPEPMSTAGAEQASSGAVPPPVHATTAPRQASAPPSARVPHDAITAVRCALDTRVFF